MEDETREEASKPAKSGIDGRETRRAAALRRNLHRRKEQARARSAETPRRRPDRIE
ncbi:MAG: hypothetical protein OXE86_19470 [Alphaproteobacteria bacterium]|nr:hypothetical protein [Alphaproteobacteria bacterium]